MTPDQLVAKTLEVVLDGIEHGDLRDVEGRLSALVQDTTSRSSTQPVRIWKIDAERRMVYGWALVSTVNGQEITDRQNDVVSTDDLRDAAHDFISKRTLGRMHEAFEGIGEIRESVVLDKGMQDALGIDLGMEGWFVGVHVKDDGTWDRVKKGELCAFSIGGTGVREPMQKMVESGTKQAERMVKGFRPGPGQVVLFNEIDAVLGKRFNPSQPRDKNGKWTTGLIRAGDLDPDTADEDARRYVEDFKRIPGVRGVRIHSIDREGGDEAISTTAVFEIEHEEGQWARIRDAIRQGDFPPAPSRPVVTSFRGLYS